MRVRAKETVFVNGSRRKAGAEFNYDGPMGDALEVIGGDAPAAMVTGPAELTRKELQMKLDSAGVKYGANDNKETLGGLLAEITAKLAPAASTAPSKEV